MHNLGDDNELDHLSREAAGKYTVPGNANWEKMQVELDKVLPVEAGRRYTSFWWLLPVLLMAGAGYWWLNTNTDADGTIQKTIQVEKTDKDNNSDQSLKNNTTIVPSNSGQKTPHVATVKEVSAPTLHKPIQAMEGKTSYPRDYSLATKADRKNETTPASITTKPTVDGQIIQPEQPVSAKGGNIDSKNISVPVKETIDKIKTDTPVADNTPRINSTKETTVATVQPEENTPAFPVTANTSIILPVFGKGWSYSLLVGVDKSTVKFRYNNDPGINIGLLGGYHFTNRFSMHTGAIFTQKNYKLAGEDFTAPKDSWINYYKLENVTGYCRMWEVPVLLRYVVSHTPKKSLYVSTGLSSYFMTSEKYNYFFYNAGQPTTRTTSYNSTDTHILSIAHLSAGFENRISKTLSLQIEPYAKLPLSGVGLGNIKLSSFGINFAVQHRQPTKK
jgi:hypothetical protein